MNLDDRLRAAYRGQLNHARDEFGDRQPDHAALAATELSELSTEPWRAAASTSRGWVLAAAAAVVLVAGVVGLSVFGGDDATPAQVVATEPGQASNVAGAPDNGSGDGNTGGDDGDGAGSNSGDTRVEVVMPTPTATSTTAPVAGARGGRLPAAEQAGADADESEPEPTVSPDALNSADTDQETSSDDATPTPQVVPTPSATAMPSATPTPSVTPTPIPTPTATATPSPTASPTPVPSPTPSPAPTPTPSPTPSPTPIPYDPGVANSVCPSGARAQLEFATLRYVGANTGWDRLDDLVDEQDGPFYFLAWEPGYPDVVTVEVVLQDPVLATDIRVAQDPYTPTAGLIEIEAAGQRIGLTLSGIEGWRVHTFGEPTPVDRLTITRSQAESNIVELLICVAPAAR